MHIYCNHNATRFIFISSQFKSGDRMSLSIGSYKIALDGDSTGDVNFISHAHSDHVRRLRMKVYASRETAELISAIYGKEISTAEPCCAKLLDAGHVLGSKQLYVEDYERGYAAVYTGDFQMEPSLVAKRIEVKQADVVIMDSTYPSPGVSFDDKLQTIDSIQRFALHTESNGIVLFNAFALGKSQEVIAMLNDCGITPVVSKKISNVSKVYRENGIYLKYISVYENPDEFEEATRRNFVGVVDNSDMISLKQGLSAAYGKKVYTAAVTGLAKIFKFATDAQFAFSDHADFKQSLRYIEEACPEIVYTFGKGREIFAKNLKALGIDAHPFEEYERMVALSGFDQNPKRLNVTKEI